MITLMVHTMSSKADINGNRYHIARITSAKTKNAILVSTYGEGNIIHKLRSFGFEWEDLYETNETIGKRRLNHLAQTANCYEHELTMEMLENLEII